MNIVDPTLAAVLQEPDLALRFECQTRIEATTYFHWKGILDRVLAACLIIPAAPLILLLIGLVRITSRGNGLFKQTRVGKRGTIFTMYKIRTMRIDAEARSGAVWSQENDPRITRLGRWLRKLHLDELPQLLNVLRGEMSFVGPRPERPEFVFVLAEEIPNYMDRLAVLPGITGLSQINLPPDTDLNSVRRKQILDIEYIRTASIWFDVRMILCTSLRMIGFSGERAMKIACVRRMVTLDPIFETPKESAQVRALPLGTRAPRSESDESERNENASVTYQTKKLNGSFAGSSSEPRRPNRKQQQGAQPPQPR